MTDENRDEKLQKIYNQDVNAAKENGVKSQL